MTASQKPVGRVHGHMSKQETVQRGQVREQTLFGTTSTYRVLGVVRGTPVLEVVSVPGLVAGDQIWVMLGAAEAMEVQR